MLQTLSRIRADEGLRGWYHGLAPSVCSVAIFWSCYFPCYGWAKARLADAAGRSIDSPTVHVGAAFGAGFVTDIVTNPLWVLRTRLVTQVLVDDQRRVGRPYRGMVDAFWTIWRNEGPLAFFAGLRASLLGLSHIMIQFPLYEAIKLELGRWGAGGGTALGASSADGAVEASGADDGSLSQVIVASAASKLAASSATYPHEVLRARMQFDHGGRLYAGLADVCRKTVAADGVAGLWQGFSLNIVRTIPQTVITFTLYEYVARELGRSALFGGGREREGVGERAGRGGPPPAVSSSRLVRTLSESPNP